jgi:hypothetical protein
MSHEIPHADDRGPSLSDLLAEAGRSDGERREWVGVIRRNARTCSTW